MTDPLHQIEQLTKKTNRLMESRTQTVFKKYPVTFSFLVLFGVISVLHGFEDLINKTPFLNNRPFLVFIIGIIILILTGSLYKKLDKKIN